MEYTNIQKNVGHSPRKVRLVADLVRKMSPVQAVDTLRFVNKAAAIDVAKAIKTALANAGTENLIFRAIEINEGFKMRRYRVGTAGRGRGRPYHKRTTHIKIVLTDEVLEKLKASSVKRQVKSLKVESVKPFGSAQGEREVRSVKAEEKNLNEEVKKEVVAEAAN